MIEALYHIIISDRQGFDRGSMNSDTQGYDRGSMISDRQWYDICSIIPNRQRKNNVLQLNN